MKRKALFVGVNTYEDEQIRDLDFSLSDAHALKTMFELFGFESDILENPNKSDVFHAVKQMTADLGTGDLFFFYFAGHGWTTTSGKHLLFCSDDMYEDLRDDDAGISFDKLKRKTNGDYNRAFVLDACRSDFITGTRGGEATTRDLRPIGDLVKDAPVKSSLAVLRSCSQYEHALEIRSRKHGLFTLAMMEVLRTSKESGIELLFGESLCDAVTDKMLCIAKAEGILSEQTPEFAKTGSAQVLIEGNRAPIPPMAMPSPDVQNFVVCPICGKNNYANETFKCKVCGRDHICLSHFSAEHNSCTKCVKTMYVQRRDELQEIFKKVVATKNGRLDQGLILGAREDETTERLDVKISGGETVCLQTEVSGNVYVGEGASLECKGFCRGDVEIRQNGRASFSSVFGDVRLDVGAMLKCSGSCGKDVLVKSNGVLKCSSVSGNIDVGKNAKVFCTGSCYGCADVAEQGKLCCSSLSGDACLMEQAELVCDGTCYGNVKIGKGGRVRCKGVSGDAGLDKNAKLDCKGTCYGDVELGESSDMVCKGLSGNARIGVNALFRCNGSCYGNVVIADGGMFMCSGTMSGNIINRGGKYEVLGRFSGDLK